jgi:ribosomal protein S27E
MQHDQVTCASCGSVYRLTSSRVIGFVNESLTCEVCGEEIYRWTGATQWTAELVERHEPGQAPATGA